MSETIESSWLSLEDWVRDVCYEMREDNRDPEGYGERLAFEMYPVCKLRNSKLLMDIFLKYSWRMPEILLDYWDDVVNILRCAGLMNDLVYIG